MGIRVPKAGERYDEFIVTETIVKGVAKYNDFAKSFHENFNETQKEWERWSKSGEGYATLFYISKAGL